MQETYISLKKFSQMYGLNYKDLKERFKSGNWFPNIPAPRKIRRGALFSYGWALSELPILGSSLGFLPKLDRPQAVAVFTTKGGVLKSTLALNIARIAALHGIKTCVVGLDIQGDVTTALGHDYNFDDSDDLETVLHKIDGVKGLSDYFQNRIQLEDLIEPTDLPSLFYIPETPELVALNDSLSNINRREYWIREKVVDKLKRKFDLVVMDCSPNWNKLTTNALVGCDLLVSPLECKINNFRNFKVFRHFLEDFQRDMKLDFKNIFVPTRYSTNRRLSREIMDWYRGNVSGCLESGVRESVIGEEATALNLSLMEHGPTKEVAQEMREVIKQVFESLSQVDERMREPEYSGPHPNQNSGSAHVWN